MSSSVKCYDSNSFPALPQEVGETCQDMARSACPEENSSWQETRESSQTCSTPCLWSSKATCPLPNSEGYWNGNILFLWSKCKISSFAHTGFSLLLIFSITQRSSLVEDSPWRSWRFDKFAGSCLIKGSLRLCETVNLRRSSPEMYLTGSRHQSQACANHRNHCGSQKNKQVCRISATERPAIERIQGASGCFPSPQ